MVRLGYSNEEKMSSLQKELESIRQHTETWLEAIVDYCQQYDLEETDVVPYLSPVIKERITEESRKRNLVKKTPGEEVTLPF